MKRGSAWIIGGVLAALVLVALLFALSDVRRLREEVAALHWGWAAAAAGLGLLFYAATAFAEQRFLAVLGHRVPTPIMLRAAIVSMVANRSLRSGGATGMAFLTWILGSTGVPATAVITCSLAFLFVSHALFTALFAMAALSAMLPGLAGDGITG